jgi:putative transposase
MKPGSYSQMYVQLVFAVKHREALLTKEIRPIVFQYVSGIITTLKHKSIIVNGVSDHIHIFIGLNPAKSVSDTIYDIKRSSSLFINQEKLCKRRFQWQEGFGSFSYSRSHINNVYNYILRQEQHHEKTRFRDEYLEFLKKYEVDYNERFLFNFFDDV